MQDKTIQLSHAVTRRKLISASLITISLSLLLISVFGRVGCERFMKIFWLEDEGLSGLSGGMRFFIYSSLLLLMETSNFPRPPIGDSPLQAACLWEKHPPQYRTVEPALSYIIPINWINTNRLRTVGRITKMGYLMSMFGLGGQIGPIVAGVGSLFLLGVSQSFVYMSHRWYIPVYTTLALMVSSGTNDFSLDAVLGNILGSSYWFSPPPSTSILRSCLGQKLVMLFSISTLFYGGVTKLMNSGLGWMDGETLKYHINTTPGKIDWMNKFLSKHQIAMVGLSVASIILEIGSVFVILSHPLSYTMRTWIFLGAIGFHLGIWLLMFPNYTPQSVCYFLVMSWPPGWSETHR